MAELKYDELVIDIKANTDKAHKNIRNLSSSIDDLIKMADSLDLSHLRDVQKLLQDIANIDFSKVSMGLYSVVKTFEAFNSKTFRAASEEIKSVEETAKKIELPALDSVGGVKSAEKIMTGLKLPLKDISVQLKDVKTDFEGIVGRSSQLTEKIEFGKEALKSLNQLSREHTKEIDAAAKAQEKLNQKSQKLQKIAIKIKSLALYRVIRLVLMKIQQTISTVIQELAQYDDNFNKSISEISSSFTFLARSLVALLNPIIQLLSPIISFITNMVGELVNSLGSLIASGLGQDTFVSATQSVEDYAESLKKAKNAVLGIDELNILSPDDTSFNFQTQQIEAQNDLSEVIKKLISELKPIFVAINNLLIALKPILKRIIHLVSNLITSTSEAVNKSIQSAIEAITSVVELLAIIIESLSPILDLLNLINTIILNLINNSLSALFTLIKTLVDLLANIIGPYLSFLGNFLGDLLAPFMAILEVLNSLYNAVFGLVEVITGQKDIEEVGNKLGYDLLNAVDGFVRTFLGAADRIGAFFGQDWNLVDNYGGGVVGMTDLAEKVKVPETTATLDTYAGVGQQTYSQQPQEIVVNIDGKEVARVVNKYNDNVGADIYSGGALSYGK